MAPRLDFLDPRHALTWLARMAVRRPRVAERWIDSVLEGRWGQRLVDIALEVAIETGSPIGRALARRIEIEQTAEVTLHLARRLAEPRYAPSLPLKETAVATFRRSVEILDDAGADDDLELRTNIVRLRHNLATLLIDLGRWVEAEEAITAVIEELRGLRQHRPDLDFELATALTHLGRLLSRLDRVEEALSASLEAVVLWRSMNRRTPGRVDLELAQSLTNLAGDLGDLGEVEKARAAAEEAVDLFTRHRDRLDELSLAAFAAAQLSLGNQLAALGSYQDALQATREAVDLHRRLAEARSDAFRPALALCLANLGILGSKVGLEEEAVRSLEEATSLFQRLETEHSGPFGADVAWVLSLRRLTEGDAEPAARAERLSFCRQAVESYRALDRQHPGSHSRQLAAALDGLAAELWAAGSYGEALAAGREAVAAFRALTPARIEDRRALGWSLLVLARVLSALNEHAEALDLAEEAVELCRERAGRTSPAVRRDLATALDDLGQRFFAAGRYAEAAAAAREAVSHYRELAREQPSVCQVDLAAILGHLANHLEGAGEAEEALEAAREAVDLHRRLEAERPGELTTGLARCLSGLSLRLRVAGRYEEALRAADEAVDRIRPIAERDPRLEAQLADSLHNRGTILIDLDRHEDAEAPLEDAAARLRSLVAQNPGDHRPDLALTLANLCAVRRRLGRPASALIAGDESVRLLRLALTDRPGFVEPRLAGALTNVAWVLLDLDRPTEALSRAEEALRLLEPLGTGSGQIVVHGLQIALGCCLEAAQAAGTEVDEEIYLRVVAALAELEVPPERDV